MKGRWAASVPWFLSIPCKGATCPNVVGQLMYPGFLVYLVREPLAQMLLGSLCTLVP